jgi:hypothetical protein
MRRRSSAGGSAQLVLPAEVLHDRRPAAAADEERRRRTVRAREVAQPAARKVCMAAVLAAGGFPVEALMPLREGVEGGLAALAVLDGADSRRPGRQLRARWANPTSRP